MLKLLMLPPVLEGVLEPLPMFIPVVSERMRVSGAKRDVEALLSSTDGARERGRVGGSALELGFVEPVGDAMEGIEGA